MNSRGIEGKMQLFVLQLDVTLKLVRLCLTTFYIFLLFFIYVLCFCFSSFLCLKIKYTWNKIKILWCLSTGWTKILRFLVECCLCPQKRNATKQQTCVELFHVPDVYLQDHFTMKISTLSGLIPVSQKIWERRSPTWIVGELSLMLFQVWRNCIPPV